MHLLPLVVLALFVLTANPARAGEPRVAGAGFLKFAVGPRAVSMGESGAAVAEDAYAAYWNPAGLALVPFPQLAATYNRSFAGAYNFNGTGNVNFTNSGAGGVIVQGMKFTQSGGVTRVLDNAGTLIFSIK